MRFPTFVFLVLALAGYADARDPVSLALPPSCLDELVRLKDACDRGREARWKQSLGNDVTSVTLPAGGGTAFVWRRRTTPPLFPFAELTKILEAGHGVALVPGLDAAAKVITAAHPQHSALTVAAGVHAPASGLWLLLGPRADRAVVVHENRHLDDLRTRVTGWATYVEGALVRLPATDAFRQLVGRRLLILLCEQRAETDEISVRGDAAVPGALMRLVAHAEATASDLEYVRWEAPALHRELVAWFARHALPGPLPPARLLPSHFE